MEGRMNISIKDCSECKEENRLFEIQKILQWRSDGNYLSALAYDKKTNEILVNEDSLMRAIQLANPGQAFRKLRLVSHEEYKNIQDKTSDFTSWNEEVKKENMAHEEPHP